MLQLQCPPGRAHSNKARGQCGSSSTCITMGTGNSIFVQTEKPSYVGGEEVSAEAAHPFAALALRPRLRCARRVPLGCSHSGRL